ncbi:MAG: hypothetical protein LBJ46_09355 [Planctomycetota bacterium]|jgi:hypothetical protein|nr:hypothetical protein [Planctomycetota bacterium]
MLKSLMNCVQRHDSDARQTRAALLMDYLEDNGSLVLDKKGLAILGLNRKQAFQTVYDLVLKEDIQMRAEEDGSVVVMSNKAFAELLEQRALDASHDQDHVAANDGDAFDLAAIAFGEEEGMESEVYAYPRNSLPIRGRDPWIAVENISFDFE